MTVRIELKRAELRQKTLETFLLYLFTYEMPLDRVRTLLDKVEGQALRGFPDLEKSGLRRSLCSELTERLRFVEASIVTGEPIDLGTCEECQADKVPRYEVPWAGITGGNEGRSVCKKCRPKYVENAVDDRTAKVERAPERVLADIAQIAFTEAGDPAAALERIRGVLDPEGIATQKVEVTP